MNDPVREIRDNTRMVLRLADALRERRARYLDAARDSADDDDEKGEALTAALEDYIKAQALADRVLEFYWWGRAQQTAEDVVILCSR